MYVPLRDESTPISLKIPWDKYTARGFVLSLIILTILVLLAPWFEVVPTSEITQQINTVPVEMLNFGEGDGTGMSKGNLSKEGESHKGSKIQNELEDASIAAKTKLAKNASADNQNLLSNYVPVKDLSSDSKNNKDLNGTGSKNTGSPDGSDKGTGIGNKGYGPGAGMGLGDIEWGGGGNRTVLYKKIPKYPTGANTNAKIRILFTVGPDGTVSNMVPLQKGDPMLEKAAMDALRQWRFNPLSSNTDMNGIITFTFKVS